MTTTTPQSITSGAEYYGADLLEDPYPWYARLRATDSASFTPPSQPDLLVPILSRYADVSMVFRDGRFGRAGFQKGAIMALGDGPLASSSSLGIVIRDPPDHTRL